MDKKNSLERLFVMGEDFPLKYIRFLASKITKKPPMKIPSELLDEYTMNGRIKIKERYFNSAQSPKIPRVYKKEQIDSLILEVKAKKKQTDWGYGETDIWLYKALEKGSIKDKNVVIMGSTFPWYESICLYYGGNCTTIEYNKIISNDPRLKLMTPDEYDEKPLRFDAAVSISSFEHDGLGRYGDPLNPNGDLEAMKKMKKILKPGRLLYFAVPVGKDKLVWNAHRIYGRIRLPLLLKGWEVLEAFGFDETLLDIDTGKVVQPVFVLKNISSEDYEIPKVKVE